MSSERAAAQASTAGSPNLRRDRAGRRRAGRVVGGGPRDRGVAGDGHGRHPQRPQPGRGDVMDVEGAHGTAAAAAVGELDRADLDQGLVPPLVVVAAEHTQVRLEQRLVGGEPGHGGLACADWSASSSASAGVTSSSTSAHDSSGGSGRTEDTPGVGQQRLGQHVERGEVLHDHRAVGLRRQRAGGEPEDLVRQQVADHRRQRPVRLGGGRRGPGRQRRGPPHRPAAPVSSLSASRIIAQHQQPCALRALHRAHQHPPSGDPGRQEQPVGRDARREQPQGVAGRVVAGRHHDDVRRRQVGPTDFGRRRAAPSTVAPQPAAVSSASSARGRRDPGATVTVAAPLRSRAVAHARATGPVPSTATRVSRKAAKRCGARSV